jgi:hypothetical protein
MQAAAQGRNVPLPLIEATAYVNSRWQWMTIPAGDGGVGPMHVTPAQMPQAVALSGHSQAEIAGDLSANLDAGAALLANAHTSGTDLASWQPAVAATQGSFVATQIFDTLRSGQTGTAGTGEQIVLSPQTLPSPAPNAPSAPNAPNGSATTGGASATAGATDFPQCSSPGQLACATWVPANLNNFSYGNRPHDYPVNMIIIHDIEGTAGSAIQAFQDPSRAASAHYVVSDAGQIWQMVAEHDIAWHAGNWDYNTRAIGIEHEGYAYAQPTWYTPAMYNQSAYLAASICSRWGVPMDRQHVIGHSEVPDPNNPGLFGGADHHTDPGPYWDWTLYMSQAQHYAAISFPSPPHMGPDPVAVNGLTNATITWQPAQTCRPANFPIPGYARPITGYTVTSTPATTTMTQGATATSATFSNLTPGTSYTFTVTAIDADGQDSLTTNAVVPGHCATDQAIAAPGSPQRSGATVQFSATATGCPNPQYQFFTQAPGSSAWQLAQAYSSTASFSMNTTGQPSGVYNIAVWARDANSPGNFTDSAGTYDTRTNLAYTVTPAYCASVSASIAPSSSGPAGTGVVTITGAASGCPSPRYQFWMLPPGSSQWQLVQPYSTTASLAWTTTGKALGKYQFSVWAQDASSPGANATSLGTEDAYAATSFTLTPTICTAVSLSAAPASPQNAGASITVTATATCPSANPQYQFVALWAGTSTWIVQRAYSPTATWTWNSSGAPSGIERFGVWVKDTGSPYAYDQVASIPFTVTNPACSAVSLSAAPASPTPSGTTITVTASSTCPNANPVYEYWAIWAGTNGWIMQRAYSTSPTWTWNSTGAPPGIERFGVWVKDASAAASTPYDAVNSITFQVT